MKKLSKLPIILGSLGLSAISAFADQVYGKDINPDYTNFYAAAGLVIGVSMVMMLTRRAKSLFR